MQSRYTANNHNPYMMVPKNLINNLDRMSTAEVKCYLEICEAITGQHDIQADNNIVARLVKLGLIKNDSDKISLVEDVKSQPPQKLKTTDETTKMLEEIEQMNGGQLPRNMLNIIFKIQDDYGFDNALTTYLAKYCIDKKGFMPNYMMSVAKAWQSQGVKTPEDAKEQSTSKYDKIVYTTLRALGRGDGQPTDAEADMITAWSKQHGLDDDTIEKVCSYTSLHTTPGKRLLYADRLMEKNGWDMEKILHAIDKKAQKTPKNIGKSNFHNFEQHEYDYESLEKLLIDN